jgi:transposase-like protein
MNKNQWQVHVSKHSTSGLSKSAYAKQHGLVYYNFIYWTKKLAQQSSDAFVAVSVSPSNTVKLKTESKSITETDKILGVLEFPNGTRLIIHHAELIAQLPSLLNAKV